MSEECGIYPVNLYTSGREWMTESYEQISEFIRHNFAPNSIADIGCGIGVFLSMMGIEDYIGVDAPDVPRGELLIPESKFIAADMRESFPALGKSFDLATCFEVAEHLPESRADALVDYLCGLSDIVGFSAAIPGQCGAGHINEQWQSWWAGKFIKRNYVTHDVRPRLWDNRAIKYWYRQNMIFYIRCDNPLILGEKTPMLDLVHPEMWLMKR